MTHRGVSMEHCSFDNSLSSTRNSKGKGYNYEFKLAYSV